MLQEPPTAVDSCSVIELCNVYSYNNAPSILLSLNLLLLSFANTSLSIVQLLQDEMDDDDYGGSSSNKKKVWQPCTIAMKRANGKYASQLKSDDLHKAHAFARLVQHLHWVGLAAILGQDKHSCFYILQANADVMASTNGADEETGKHQILC